MNPMKCIAQSAWLRLIFGGIAAGCVIYGLVHSHPRVAVVAVPLAIVVGAISCSVCEHLVEALVKAMLSGVIVFLSLRMAPKMMAGDPQWWKIAILSLPLGFLGGVGVGSILGAVCRLAWRPVSGNHDRSSNEK